MTGEPVDLLAALQASVDRAIAARRGAPDRRTATKTAPESDHPTPNDSEAQNRDSRSPVTYGCGGCDNRWQGVSRCHCSGCHRTFGGAGLFDRHQRLRNEVRTCLDPETITSTNKETHEQERVMWLVGGLWISEENPVGRKPPVRRPVLRDLSGAGGL